MTTSILFTMLGVLAIFAGLTLLSRKNINSVRCSKKATGTVTDIIINEKTESSAESYSPVIAYSVNGEEKSFSGSTVTYNPKEFSKGDKYRLNYNPGNPEEFILIEKVSLYKRPLGILLIILGMISFALSVSFSSDASDGNVYTKEFTYTNPSTGKTYGASLEIRSSSEDDWNLRLDSVNDETADGFVYYRLSANGKAGDIITASVTSEYDGTYLGLTLMPKVDGNWQKGTQFTTFVQDGSANSLSNEYVITGDDSDLQITASAYSNMFASKKAGSMDVVFLIEMNGHTDATTKKSNLGSLILTIFGGTMFLIILAGILSKINAYKKKNK